MGSHDCRVIVQDPMVHARALCNPGLTCAHTAVVDDREDTVLWSEDPSKAAELEETVVRMRVRGELEGEGEGEICPTSWPIDGRGASAVIVLRLQSCHIGAPRGSDNRHWLRLIERYLEVLRT